MLAAAETTDGEDQFSEQVSLNPPNSQAQMELKLAQSCSSQFNNKPWTLQRSSNFQPVQFQPQPQVYPQQKLNPEEPFSGHHQKQQQFFFGGAEELPRLEVQDLSSYHHSAHQEIEESTFMQMDVPQGPGAALRFLSDDQSTCFTPNFEPAQSRRDTEFMQSRSVAQAVDFEFATTQSEQCEEASSNVMTLTEQSQAMEFQQRDSSAISSRYLQEGGMTTDMCQQNRVQEEMEDESMYPWLRERDMNRPSQLSLASKSSQNVKQAQGSCSVPTTQNSSDVTLMTDNGGAQAMSVSSIVSQGEEGSQSFKALEMTPDATKKLDSDRDSILQFAPLSVNKNSVRRNEQVGPNEQRYQVYHSQLSQILSQHQHENTAFMNSQQVACQEEPSQASEFGMICKPQGAKKTLFQTVQEEDYGDRRGVDEGQSNQEPMSASSNFFM